MNNTPTDKKILITGGCGFVGSSLAIDIKKKYPQYEVTVIDNLKRSGSELNLMRLKENGIIFVHGDIRCKEDLEGFTNINVVIDAAAEPSVLAGLNGSTDYLIHANLNGTIHCLNLALRNKADFIFISTSRVYPIQPLEAIRFTEQQTRFEISEKQDNIGISKKGVSEQFTLTGARSLYGATKLASELLITEYHEMLGLRTVVNRCGVITGPYQMGKVDQGVVVLWVAKHFWNKQLSYVGYGGEGKQVRDILHVHDLFRLVDMQMHQMEKVNGKTYNVGGGSEISISLQELTQLCEDATGNKIPIDKIKETRQADVRIYITDNTLVHNELGWKPEIKPDKIISEIYYWIKQNEHQLKPILS